MRSKEDDTVSIDEFMPRDRHLYKLLSSRLHLVVFAVTNAHIIFVLLPWISLTDLDGLLVNNISHAHHSETSSEAV